MALISARILVILSLLWLWALSTPIVKALEVVVLNRTAIEVPGSILSFNLFAPTESVTAVALLKARKVRGPLRLCLLVDAQ